MRWEYMFSLRNILWNVEGRNILDHFFITKRGRKIKSDLKQELRQRSRILRNRRRTFFAVTVLIWLPKQKEYVPPVWAVKVRRPSVSFSPRYTSVPS